MTHSLSTLVPDEPGAPTATVLHLGLDVDAVDTPALERLLSRLDGEWVHLDLTRLGHTGAAFVDGLLRLARRVDGRGARLTLGPLPPLLARVFVLLGLEERFEVHADPRAALDATWCCPTSTR